MLLKLKTVSSYNIMIFKRKSIDDKVVPSPLNIRIGEINTFRITSARMRRLHAERTGVSKQIEKAFTFCKRCHFLPRFPVIQKETRIEIVCQINKEFNPILQNLEKLLPIAHFFMLLNLLSLS